MKKLSLTLLPLVVVVLLAHDVRSRAADEATFQTTEYATIRWGGRENTRLIRPNGKVENLRTILEKYPRPEGFDDRSYYLNIAMNAAAREGYEFAGMTSDEIVMKRVIPK